MEERMAKFRKKRKLTEEQKEVLRERITKARQAKKPSEQKSIHHSLRDLPDDHPLGVSNIRAWIKVSKEKLSGMRGWRNSTVKGQRAKFYEEETYLHNLQAYLRDGTYRDMFYGEHRNKKIKNRVVVMAYHADGTPKRNIGFWYPDIGCEYTREMYEEEYGPTTIPHKGKVHKTRRKRSKRT